MAVDEAQSDHSFFWRKLHSLTGIIPVGAYLVDHLWSNSYALVSTRLYDEKSQELQTVPWRIFVEAAVIWAPILYHALYGVYIWWRGKSNVSSYPWVGNFTYALQRWTGLIAFVFIGWHVYTERFLTHGKSTFDQVQGALSNPYYFAFYLIGVVSCCIHLGSGVWNFLCKWGLAATVRAQRMAGYLGIGVAAALSVMAVAILLSFRFDWHPFIFYVNPPK
jgi:succinate dehydrogenase / fumarate reductase cytochrome b subunit